jgi:hypothetical protein
MKNFLIVLNEIAVIATSAIVFWLLIKALIKKFKIFESIQNRVSKMKFKKVLQFISFFPILFLCSLAQNNLKVNYLQCCGLMGFLLSLYGCFFVVEQYSIFSYGNSTKDCEFFG